MMMMNDDDDDGDDDDDEVPIQSSAASQRQVHQCNWVSPAGAWHGKRGVGALSAGFRWPSDSKKLEQSNQDQDYIRLRLRLSYIIY